VVVVWLRTALIMGKHGAVLVSTAFCIFDFIKTGAILAHICCKL